MAAVNTNARLDGERHAPTASVRREESGDGEILVEIWPVDPDAAPDGPPVRALRDDLAPVSQLDPKRHVRARYTDHQGLKPNG